MWFSHSMRGTFGKWLFLYRQRCLASPCGKAINSPFSASQAVLLQLCSPFCPGRPARGTGEVIVCPLTLVPKNILCEPWRLICLRINHLYFSSAWSSHVGHLQGFIFKSLCKSNHCIILPLLINLLFPHPQWILVWALSWTGQWAGETLLLGLHTGWLQKLLPVMRIQMLRMITE